MPRSPGTDYYELPSVYQATPGTLIRATQHNTPLEDLAADNNAARPVVAGGTGAITADAARTNLDVYGKAETYSRTEIEGLAHTATADATPDDADEIGFWSTVDGALRKLTFANLKAVLKTYFDGLYSALGHTHAFASLTSKPTTLAGYGITDAYDQNIGVAQTWQNVIGTRTHSTSYQNTTGKPILVCLNGLGGTVRDAEVSNDNSTWVRIGRMNNAAYQGVTFVVPSGWYYRINGSTTVDYWAELR